MFKKLLDFDEICFEGPVVEEERGVCTWGQVLELSGFPGEHRVRLTKCQVTYGGLFVVYSTNMTRAFKYCLLFKQFFY